MFNFSKRQNTKHHVHNFTIKGTHAFDVDINHLSYRFASYSCSSDYLQTITVEIVNPFSENKKKEFVYLFTSDDQEEFSLCLLYTSPSPRDRQKSRMPSSA